MVAPRTKAMPPFAIAGMSLSDGAACADGTVAHTIATADPTVTASAATLFDHVAEGIPAQSHHFRTSAPLKHTPADNCHGAIRNLVRLRALSVRWRR